MNYPLEERAGLVRHQDISRYLNHLFQGVEYGVDDWVCFRGIGEKGTDKEGAPMEEPIQAYFVNVTEKGEALSTLWAQYETGAFIIPAVLSSDRATAAHVKALTAVIVDVDSGDTIAKLRWMQRHIGKPTMVVMSGGVTECGKYKMHCYYCLDGPSEDIGRVVGLRDKLARAVGGDLSFGLGTDSNPFGRAHQPIRIAGSVHGKNGVASVSKIADGSDLYFTVDEPRVYQPVKSYSMFGPEVMSTYGKYKDTLDKEIHEGGDGTQTRWHAFNVVAGEHIRMFRLGEVSEEEAFNKTDEWIQTKMVPPWSASKVDQQWRGLLSCDRQRNPEVIPPVNVKPTPVQPDNPNQLETRAWWNRLEKRNGEKPKRKWLVEGLILQGKAQSLTAAGGAGKTYSLIDLAAQVATWKVDEDCYWAGQKVHRGGTVVFLTNEDDYDELDIRAFELGIEDKIKEAGNKLIVISGVDEGGSFTMVQKDRNGILTLNKKWEDLKGWLMEVPDLALFAVDTYASIAHGSENDTSTIGEIVNEVNQVCKATGSAFVLTHHVRKTSRDLPVKTKEDMLDSVRGSTAFTSCFRVNLGLYSLYDYEEPCKKLGIKVEKDALWNLAVIKANNPEVIQEPKILLREGGTFTDVTDRLKVDDATATSTRDEQLRAMTCAIKEGAARGKPYKEVGRTAAGGTKKRDDEMPPPLWGISGADHENLVSYLLKTGAIVRATIGKGSTNYLDVPNGKLANDDYYEKSGGAYEKPDWRDYRDYPEDEYYGKK